ncbi:uncharacterized protein C8Q71DRAFT_849287 [Rhodofomes roseus]|uniref:Protein kinase domain-containing protein n=1 Tax=Rhodofomes roseus TaxID=34475 RepID=A0ABQ8KAJ0_9APHY|nr:uncharacterized protein C8Q71DRAFT_849287 [Rhodofomes roseus]KAH9834409.1 hypothetical protein C8Q71DRAFT_849287 [Rhodofomes roseus]
MPLGLSTSGFTTTDILRLAVDVAAATQEIANLASFPPAAIAAGILLEIFQTVQKIHTNKVECECLANRCLSILCRVRDQMQGRWEATPPSLLKAIKAFETTLESIQGFLASEASKTWRTRLHRKSTIEKALASFGTRLDDAERSFQIATLINIHRAVGDRTTSTAPDTLKRSSTIRQPGTSRGAAARKDSDMSDISTLVENQASEGCYNLKSSSDTHSPGSEVQRVAVMHHSNPVEARNFGAVSSPEPSVLRATALARGSQTAVDVDGFRRYHQSDLALRGRSRTQEGWWASTAQAEVDGQRVLVKRYEGPRDAACEQWRHDLDILRHAPHAEVVRMLGYSRDECPTPFIVLANSPLTDAFTQIRHGYRKV